MPLGKSATVVKQASVRASLSLNRLHTFTASTAVWLFVRDPKSLDEIEQEDLATFCQASPTLKRTYDLVQDFMQMVRKREGHRLDAWLERIVTSDLAELQPFAAGVEKDKAAVKAGLTWSINNAQVEGQVTKLKLNELPRSKLTGYLPSRTAKAALSFAQQAAGN